MDSSEKQQYRPQQYPVIEEDRKLPAKETPITTKADTVEAPLPTKPWSEDNNTEKPEPSTTTTTRSICGTDGSSPPPSLDRDDLAKVAMGVAAGVAAAPTAAADDDGHEFIKQEIRLTAAMLPTPSGNEKDNEKQINKDEKEELMDDDFSHLVQTWAEASHTDNGGSATSAATPTAPRTNSRPGAFPVGTPLDTTNTNGTSSPQASLPTHVEIEMGGQAQPDEEDDSGLMEAKLVDDDEEAATARRKELPTALEYDQEQHQATKQRQQALLAIQGTACAIGLLVLVILIPVLLLRQDGTSVEGTGGDVATNNQSTTTMVAPSSSSSSPHLSLEDHVLSLLPNDTIERISMGNDTPQALALQWLLQDPVLLHHNSTSSSLPHYYPDWRFLQRYALATFYFATNKNGPHGNSWFNQHDWLNYSIPECQWFTRPTFNLWPWDQVEDERACPPSLPNSTTGTRQEYTKLSLHENNLQGTLPPELYLLTALTSLSLYANPLLQGTIDTQIGHLTHLQHLYMASLEGLTGTLPTELGLLSSSMQDMRFIHSSLQGSIPSELGRLSNLAMVFWDGNDLTGTLPSEFFGIGNSLQHLYLFGNSLTGTLPTEMGQMSLVQQIALDVNLLTGTMPTEMGRLDNLTVFNLGENLLSGQLPTELGVLTTHLQHIKAQNNLLTGWPLQAMLPLSHNLKQIRLHHNQLNGTLASELGLLTLVERFLVQSNQLTGTIPSELAALVDNMMVMDLTDNPGLLGTIPDELCSVGWNVTTCPWSQWECQLTFDCSERLCGCDCEC